MKITEVRIRRNKKASVKAHAIICFDDCFFGPGTQSLQRTGGTLPFVSSQGAERRDPLGYAFPLIAETRRMIEQAVLAEYEKVVAPSEGKADAK